MTDDPDLKMIPPNAVIIDAISNIVGTCVSGLSKRTQYYSFIDAAKGNSLQQPYLAWFAKHVLESLEKAEKRDISNCFEAVDGDRRYRGILIDDAEKVALAESRFSRCKGWFEDAHKSTAIFRAYFVLDRILQKQDIPAEKRSTIPTVMRIAKREFEKIYQSYDETLLDTPNLVEDRLQNTLATLLSKPLYGAYYALDAVMYHMLGISAQYPDLEPRTGFSFRIVPGITKLLALAPNRDLENRESQFIPLQKLVGIGPLSERQAAKIATWLTTNSFSKVKEVITTNGKNIFNSAVAIALGTVLSTTIVTNILTPQATALDPAFVEAIKAAKFDLFTFKNGDLGIVTYEMPNIPERMRYGDVCRIAWRDVNKSFARNHTANIMDLVDQRCPEGFLAAPVEAFYDEHSKGFAVKINTVELAEQSAQIKDEVNAVKVDTEQEDNRLELDSVVHQ